MKYLKIFVDFADCLEDLEEAEQGRLLMGMLRYAHDGRLPELRGNERFLWKTAQQQIDRMREQYEKLCASNAANSRKRFRPPAPQETSYDIEEIRQLMEQDSGG